LQRAFLKQLVRHIAPARTKYRNEHQQPAKKRNLTRTSRNRFCE